MTTEIQEIKELEINLSKKTESRHVKQDPIAMFVKIIILLKRQLILCNKSIIIFIAYLTIFKV